ncbi:MAG: tRNA lysidine(34) synthetase TilS [Verrucomicrobiota bacterium]
MSPFVTGVRQAIAQHELLQRGQRLLVAVSGGLDSMALLHVLHGLAEEFCWRLVVVHFNHQLRGAESEADERFVRQAAGRLELKCIVGREDVRQMAAQSKLSIEMAARELRHRFFAKTARRLKVRTVALAHQADDQVELFFLRLLRGSGGGGLGGMNWASVSPEDTRVTLIRPLLNQRRESIEAFARAGGIQWREDSSNTSLEHQRNRVRHKLLPLLRRHFGEAVGNSVRRSMELIAAENEFVGEAARQWLRQQVCAFDRLHVAVQRRAVHDQLIERGIVATYEAIELLRAAANSPVVVEPGLAVVRSEEGLVRLERLAPAPVFETRDTLIKVAGGRGERVFGGVRFSWRLGPEGGAPRLTRKPANVEWFDAEAVGGHIRLRHWRGGDRFQPIGMKQPVKLQDLFTNLKIPREQRHKLIVAEAEGKGVFWVEGLRIGEPFKLTPQTRRRLVWQWWREAV